MTILEIVLIAIGLAMDAFAVSISKGMATKKLDIKKMTIISTYFGVFQALMPILGYILSKSFESYVIQIDHWIAFILLSFLGLNMIKESFVNEQNESSDLSVNTMIPLAIATSIDALAIGITFAFLKVNILSSSAIIGTITFTISMIGVTIGCKFKGFFGSKAEFLGGVILIIMGFKILLEHLQIF